MSHGRTVCGALVLALASSWCLAGTGGPLAGVDLPPFPTQHGEKPGYPGCIPELMAQGKKVQDMGNEYVEWGPQGLPPELELYQGAVEHYRAYMFKYMPIRSFFDRQSQVKNFVAPDLPGAEAAQVEEYAEPVFWVPRHADPRPTGRFAKPVKVVRMKVGTPTLKLDLGELTQGLYAVRVIGAVEAKSVRPFREPLFLRMTVNDGLNGETSSYRLRLGYCEQFYSVAEVYFHAPERRAYRAELAVDRGSTVDLLAHNVSLDDALAGVERRAVKTRRTIAPPLTLKQPEPADRQKVLDRDARLWNDMPPVNAQGSVIGPDFGGYGAIAHVRAGADNMDGKEIVKQHGTWTIPAIRGRDPKAAGGARPDDAFLVNAYLNLSYTWDDLRNQRPLPDPYPFKDDGAGLYFPDPADPKSGSAWTPIGSQVHAAIRDYYGRVGKALARARQSGVYEDAHEAGLSLARWAYGFPAIDFSEYLSNTIHESGPFGRDYSCRRRETVAFFLPHYPMYVDPLMYQYDDLFEFIKGDNLLAESVSRFVPWVKTPEDVVRLIDGYLVQTTAKRILRYHYHTDPMDIANLAAVVGDTSFTDPWMEWLFSRTFIYPLPCAGIQDTMVSGCTREGCEIVGSTYYAQGEGASRIPASLEQYLRAGGNPRFSLSDPARYPKPVAHTLWRIENVVAGWDFLRIGDVCGPDKTPGHTLRDLEFARDGWRWTRDPRFAFILKHYAKPKQESAEDWAAIEKAAADCPRAPWLDNRSRVMPMWAGVLETGLGLDDPRFRRAAYVRVGFGMGHQHSDTLDLQVAAHGLPMTIDAGQRPGYSKPGDGVSRVHNTVEVDGRSHLAYSWVTALADCEGSRYLAATATPPANVRLFRRQVALIDVDSGQGHQPVPIAQQRPGALLPAGVVTPNSYVFDVFRVDGGGRHTYCFHGPLHDDFEWNARDAAKPAEGSDEATYLAMFKERPDLSLAGKASDPFQATWRMARTVEGPGAGEQEMLGNAYDPKSPRKFTRLHVLGAGDAAAMRGQLVCVQWKYDFTNAFVQRKAVEGQSLSTAFAAVIEPYAGEPFITEVKRLAPAGAGPDALQPVAVSVKTRNGLADVCLASANPEAAVTVPLPRPNASLSAAGEFAYYSTDGEGLRQAMVTGGRLLETPEVRLLPAAAERTGKVTRVDYWKKMLWIDAKWPATRRPEAFEIGLLGTDHMTAYTISSVEPFAEGSLITVTQGADYYRSTINEVRPDGVVECVLKPLMELAPGNREGWVATDDNASVQWRAKHMVGGAFQLAGPPTDLKAFGDAKALRLWECGVGDSVRQSTWLALRRVGPGLFQVEGNVEARIESAQGMTARRADGAALAQTAVRALSLSYEDVASGKTLIQFPKP